MKKILINYSLLTLLISVLFVSCDKTISSDLPLPGVRSEAVYITTDNLTLQSFNASTGKKRWETQLDGKSNGVPVIYNGKMYLGTEASSIYITTLDSGKVEKRIFAKTQVNQSLLVNVNGIYVGGIDSMYLYNFDGTVKWSTPGPVNVAPQLYNGDVIYAGANKINSVDAFFGNNIGNWVFTDSTITNSPRASGGLIYFGTNNGTTNRMVAIDDLGSAPKWKFTASDKFLSSPVVYGGMCIVGNQNNNIYCIDSTSGLQRWKVTTGDRVSSSPIIFPEKNYVLVGSYDFNLYAINFVTGVVAWKYPTGSIIKSSPVLYGNKLYFTALDNYIYCIDARDGTTLWKTYVGGGVTNSPMVDDLANGQYPTISGNSQY
jgi:outer membrane protein assembly factor BamB